MGRLGNVSDGELERLLAGNAPHGDEELEALTTFVEDIKDTFTVSPDEATEARHLAAIVEAAHLLADKGEPVARPASKADGPAQQASRLPKRRRKLVGDWLDSIVARAVVGSVAVFATTGGLAFAGALPDPLQEAAVDVADTVGVTLPDPDDPSPLDEDAPTVIVDDLEAVEPENVQTQEEDEEPDDDGNDGEDTDDKQAAAGGAGAAADNADDTETAGGGNQAAAGGGDDSDDTKQGNGQAGAGGNQAGGSDETDDTDQQQQQQQQQEDDTESEDDT